MTDGMGYPTGSADLRTSVHKGEASTESSQESHAVGVLSSRWEKSTESGWVVDSMGAGTAVAFECDAYAQLAGIVELNHHDAAPTASAVGHCSILRAELHKAQTGEKENYIVADDRLAAEEHLCRGPESEASVFHPWKKSEEDGRFHRSCWWVSIGFTFAGQFAGRPARCFIFL